MIKEDIEIKKEIGKKLKKARIEREMTAKELAKVMRVSVETVWHWEAARRNLTGVDLIKLKEFFGDDLEI